MSFPRVLERLVQLPVVLFGVSLVVFLMITLTPGDPVEIMLADQRATEEQAAMLRADLGLDRPLVERYLVFLGNAVTGDFGLSFFHRRPVIEVIAERLPATIELTLVALLIALLVAVPLGVAAAVRRDSWLDRGLSALSLFGVSLPGFWFGILLILLFAVQLGLLPVGGRIPFDAEVPRLTGFLLLDTLAAGRPDAFLRALSHLLLPAVTLGLPAAALLARVIRSSMVEVLAADYVLFAEAKGLPRRRVLYVHALKNALIPAVTVLAIEMGQLLGGSMIVETVFGWPGLGRVVVESIFARNYPLVQAAVLLYAVIYVLLNFCADLLYAALNPKVRL
ncbi:ABC transporter permease [Falsiroseomonas oryzae]|uniref:ABC transporter permease n=1 Tax=Falsiroseomonas oryzae TaxID=2766473 RepID=UPI0022EA7F67|nr:ABC transporter permease [Roseomonas sp. MO-31]